MAHVEPNDRARWLILIHQIPPRPPYLRAKIWKHLQRLGAVAIKNSVYALPRGSTVHEGLHWILQEIVAGGGDASLCEASFLAGLTDEQVEALFQRARDADYARLAEEAGELQRRLGPAARKLDEATGEEGRSTLARLQRRLAQVVAIDFFGAPGRAAVDERLHRLAARLRPAPPRTLPPPAGGLLQGEGGRTWVTRRGIHVDRMASAWLIQRFIDPRARFKFVAAKGYRPEPGELRFDMFEAEFTHEGDLCTFEVLLRRGGLTEPALRPIAEVVHDIDLRDERYGRPETAGIERMVAAIAVAHDLDEARLERASAMLDDLLELYRRKR